MKPSLQIPVDVIRINMSWKRKSDLEFSTIIMSQVATQYLYNSWHKLYRIFVYTDLCIISYTKLHIFNTKYFQCIFRRLKLEILYTQKWWVNRLAEPLRVYKQWVYCTICMYKHCVQIYSKVQCINKIQHHILIQSTYEIGPNLNY